MASKKTKNLSGSKYIKIGKNYWTADEYTYEEALAASKTLKDCVNCLDCHSLVDCRDCVECVRSERLVNCRECLGCADCVDCEKCTNCRNCEDLYGVASYNPRSPDNDD